MTRPPARRTAQEVGIKMGNRVVEDTQPRISQLISATIHLTGDQDLRVDTFGSRTDRGGHIAIASDSLLIYLHSQKAANLYAKAWIDSWYVASRLPERLATDPRPDPGPVMMVRAYGSESVQHVHDPARGAAMIRIGRLTWILHDQAAWTSTTAAWRKVEELAPLVISPENTKPLPRREGHRRRPAPWDTPTMPPVTPPRGPEL